MPSFTLSQFILLIALWVTPILAADTLTTSGFTTCDPKSDVKVQKLDISYSRSSRQLNFDVAGTSEKEENVTASLTVFAYGNQVYSKQFDPCSSDHYIKQLCPGKSAHLLFGILLTDVISTCRHLLCLWFPGNPPKVRQQDPLHRLLYPRLGRSRQDGP